MEDIFPAAWTGDLVGKMHVNRVKRSDLAKELGVTEAYISMMLNSKRNTKGMQEKLERAYDSVIAKRDKIGE